MSFSGRCLLFSCYLFLYLIYYSQANRFNDIAYRENSHKIRYWKYVLKLSTKELFYPYEQGSQYDRHSHKNQNGNAYSH